MVMPSKCPFCGETYGDAVEHWCVNEIIIRGEEAGRLLKEWADAINKEAEKSYDKLRKL